MCLHCLGHSGEQHRGPPSLKDVIQEPGFSKCSPRPAAGFQGQSSQRRATQPHPGLEPGFEPRRPNPEAWAPSMMKGCLDLKLAQTHSYQMGK